MVRSLLAGGLCSMLLLTGLPGSVRGGTEAEAPAGAKAPAPLPDEAVGVAETIPVPAHVPSMPRIVGTEVVSQVTGRDSPNDTATRWDVHGTDLGHMFWHRGKLHMVFGDTFGAPGMVGRKNWRSNTMALISDPDPRNGFPIETMIAGLDGMAKELLHSLKVGGLEKTVIPTFGVSVGTRMYLHYMSVKRWGVPGHWEVGQSGIAYSDDDGRTWVKPQSGGWPQGIGFDQVAFVVDEGVLYTFGIPEGRFGGVRLRRVAPERILAADAYEYWDGEGWAADHGKAAIVVPSPVGELSVAWSETNRRWLMMYLEPERQSVVLRIAPQLTGPWSAPQDVVTVADYPGLYAPYIVPDSEIGADLYYTMSQWDPYNVYLMRTTLEWGGVATVSISGDETPGDGTPGDGRPPVTGRN